MRLFWVEVNDEAAVGLGCGIIVSVQKTSIVIFPCHRPVNIFHFLLVLGFSQVRGRKLFKILFLHFYLTHTLIPQAYAQKTSYLGKEGEEAA